MKKRIIGDRIPIIVECSCQKEVKTVIIKLLRNLSPRYDVSITDRYICNKNYIYLFRTTYEMINMDVTTTLDIVDFFKVGDLYE